MKHSYWEVNPCADVWANFGCSLIGNVVYFSSCPSFVSLLVTGHNRCKRGFKVPFSLDHLYFGSNLYQFFSNIDQTRHTDFIIVQQHGITLSLFHPLTSMYMLSLSPSVPFHFFFMSISFTNQSPPFLHSFMFFFTTTTPLL